MDSLSVFTWLQLGAQFGLAGVVLVLWFLSDRSKSQFIEKYRQDVAKILGQYGNDMEEIRRMYESNVRLVKRYEDVAKDLKDVVIINTQAMTRLGDDIRNNQYCPKVRLQKQARGKQA